MSKDTFSDTPTRPHADEARESAYKNFHKQILTLIPSARVITDYPRRFAMGTDAGFYRLVPRMVIKTQGEDELSFILTAASQFGIPVTFRAAGTSLSGQAITDSVLLVATDGWQRSEIILEGERISLEPGIIGEHANLLLAPFGRRIGPDPASLKSAMIGGIAANNASGMCCGTVENSYATLIGMRIIFADGSSLDTLDSDSRKRFEESHSHIINGVLALRHEVMQSPKMREIIRKKYRIKNTTGYGMNSLLDFDDPFDIISHLMIGSEGTLGFISNITLRTVREPIVRASSLMIFSSIQDACLAVQSLDRNIVSAAELMDRESLRSVENKTGVPAYLKELDDRVAALLVEVASDHADMLQSRCEEIKKRVSAYAPIFPINFLTVKEDYEKLWSVRGGILPSVGAARAQGTTSIIEDIAVPLDQLASAISVLREMMNEYGYSDGVIFGHALDGNVHFVFAQNFNDPLEITRYQKFMQRVSEMVANEFSGSLKAEHGTGRNMAPFVELEWGGEIYKLMRDVKRLFDPVNILNPGVLLNDDKHVHLKNFKSMSLVNDKIDKCIECGFCERNCPSRKFTLTPRQRIAVEREKVRLKNDSFRASNHHLHELQKSHAYLVKDTCAADGMCAVACPVSIDTGTYVKFLRSQDVGWFAKKIAWWLARHFAGTTAAVRLLLKMSSMAHKLFGSRMMTLFTSMLYKISIHKIPLWNPYLPTAVKRFEKRQWLKLAQESNNETTTPLSFVYFPSCVARNMGAAAFDSEKKSLPLTVVTLLRRAGATISFPDKCESLCCGLMFASKGYTEQADYKISELKKALLQASDGGKIPVLCDTSPCSHRMKEHLSSDLKIIDTVELLHDYLMQHLDVSKKEKQVALHVPCSGTKMGIEHKFRELLYECSESVYENRLIKCCGFAGDRGFFFPKLNSSALSTMHVPSDVVEGVSSSRTCEIGLSNHSGITFHSIAYLVERCTQSDTDKNTKS